MAHYVRNISKKHGYILQRQVEPQATICLEDIFPGFCKPKVASRDDKKKLEDAEARGIEVTGINAEFQPDEFPRFLEMARKLAKDPALWQMWSDEDAPEDSAVVEKKPNRRSQIDDQPAAQPAVATGNKGTVKSQAIQKKDIKRKLPSETSWTPQELARLPYNEDTKKIIADAGVDQMRSLKQALKLVRHLPGQERTRKLIEDKIEDLRRD